MQQGTQTTYPPLPGPFKEPWEAVHALLIRFTPLEAAAFLQVNHGLIYRARNDAYYSPSLLAAMRKCGILETHISISADVTVEERYALHTIASKWGGWAAMLRLLASGQLEVREVNE